MVDRIKVLIIDDSALARQVLSQFLSADPHIEVVGVAPDPIIAWDKIEKLHPDVITLDVEMPRMDGLTFLERLMSERPMPVLMVSSLTEKSCETTLKALEIGAIDFVTKPKIDIVEKLPQVMAEVIEKVKVTAKAKVKPSVRRFIPFPIDARGTKVVSHAMVETTDKVVAIGASTGGTEAIAAFLTALPADAPGVCVVQHMPEKFTKVFSERLNSICRVHVKEARDGDSVLKGHVFIAPGNFHMLLKRSGARYYVEVNNGPILNHHRPSVDLLFKSVAKNAGPNAIGVIMTGMGHDGAEGLKEMKDTGAITVAQDEESCVVFGMPKEAIRIGAVDKILPLQELPGFVMEIVEELNHSISEKKMKSN